MWMNAAAGGDYCTSDFARAIRRRLAQSQAFSHECTMKPIHWSSDTDFVIDGVRFVCGLYDYNLKTDGERIVILKLRENIESYERMLGPLAPRNVLELGIYQGGSPALFTAWFELDKFVGIDICEPVEGFDEFCARHPLGKRIRTHYRVSQADRERIDAIVREEFGETPIDVILDDASHSYSLSRRAFEIAFPHLRPGGCYVIEDWGWAHWPGSSLYPGETPLSMLIMELTMLCAARSDLISEIVVLPAYAFIRKAPQAPRLKTLSLDSLLTKRGIELVGARDLNLAGVAKLMVQQVRHRAQRKLARLRKRSRT
jgi:hypothetical protein